MRWQYRTIVFESQKDGLLGDRFIDDEGVEKTLNEQGRAGWELVSATMIQDGLLTLFKRPDPEADFETAIQPKSAAMSADSQGVPGMVEDKSFTAEELKQAERDHIRALEQQRKQAMKDQEKCMVGDIKIR
jgi:hypothetical protein